VLRVERLDLVRRDLALGTDRERARDRRVERAVSPTSITLITL